MGVEANENCSDRVYGLFDSQIGLREIQKGSDYIGYRTRS